MDFRRVSNKRLMLWGDRKRAASHIGEGNSLLHICQLQAGFQELDHFQMVRNLEDGTRIIARTYAGLSDVIITSPFTEKPKKEDAVIEDEVFELIAMCGNMQANTMAFLHFDEELNSLVKASANTDVHPHFTYTAYEKPLTGGTAKVYPHQGTFYNGRYFFLKYDPESYFEYYQFGGSSGSVRQGFAKVFLCGTNPEFTKEIVLWEYTGSFDGAGNPMYAQVEDYAWHCEMVCYKNILYIRSLPIPGYPNMQWRKFDMTGEPAGRILFEAHSNMWAEDAWWAQVSGNKLWFGINTWGGGFHYVKSLDLIDEVIDYSNTLPTLGYFFGIYGVGTILDDVIYYTWDYYNKDNPADAYVGVQVPGSSVDKNIALPFATGTHYPTCMAASNRFVYSGITGAYTSSSLTESGTIELIRNAVFVKSILLSDFVSPDLEAIKMIAVKKKIARFEQ